MKRFRITLISITLFLAHTTFSQGLTAYEDFRGGLVVFDNGVSKVLEIQPVQRFGIGGRAIPYIDNLGYFKIYQDGKVNDVAFGPNIEFRATDNLVSYFFNDQLWVFDNGKSELLSVWVESFQTSDQTVAYLDNNNNEFSVYQNKQKHVLEDIITGVNEIDYKVGENLVAYNFQDQFKIFINGTSFEILFNNKPSTYKVGKNIVAYVDGQEDSFNTFYLGKQQQLEDFTPEWYQMGDNMVVYKDQLGVLKMYHKGKKTILSTNDPTNVKITDNVCTFMDQEQFKIFFNGKITTLEYFPPLGSTLENNSVIYQDQTGSLRYFDGEKGEVITSEIIASYYVNLNTVTFRNRANRSKVFYKGEIY